MNSPEKNSMYRRVTRLLRHQTGATAIYLYGAHLLNYLVPALTVALLTRRFSPSCYGRLIIAQSLGLTVSTITEYGFRWTGSRAIAENEHPSKLNSLVSSIAAAKFLIAIACSILIPITMLCIRSMEGQLWLVISGYVWGVIQGSDFQWYFLGRERLLAYLTVDSLLRTLAVALILLVVHSDHDVGRVLAIQSVCTAGLLVWAVRRIARDVGFVQPTFDGITDAMHEGGALFLQQLARYASGGINIAVLATVSSPANVGFFGCADKLVRYSASLGAPITQLLYPKISKHIGSSSHESAEHLVKIAAWSSLSLALLSSGAIFAMPYFIVRTLYGTKMLAAIPALRILAIFPILNSLTTSLVYYWLLPRRLEKLSLRVMCFAGVVNVVTVAILGKFWNQAGAAGAVIFTEAITLIGYLVALKASQAKGRDAKEYDPVTEEVA